MGMFSGYRADVERLDLLAANASPFAPQAICRGAVPDEIDHRGWLQIENQGAEGSCAGHMASSILEVCNYIQTGGYVVQLARMFAYLTGQQIAGLIGYDQGCTIQGVLEAAKQRGICLESTFPYSGRYSTDIPQAAFVEAAQHRLRNYSVMRSYAEMFAFQSLGIGGGGGGFPWLQAMASNRSGVIELADVQEHRGNQSLGMHAYPYLGYSKRKSADGRNYLWLPNSHGRGWGINGWAEVSPLAVDHQAEIGCFMFGASDMGIYGQRQIKSFKGMFSR